MSNFATQADHLREEALRTEESHRMKRDTPLSWYYRVRNITFLEDRDAYSCDFDEDISELEEDEERERDDAECVCGGADSECDCQFDSDDSMDGDESERSFDGSEADYYYELKEKREERKQEMLRERQEKERRSQYEKSKEEEVRAAYRSLDTTENECKPAHIGPLAGQSFRLFCSDHVDYFYCDLSPTKRVDFYQFDDMDDHHPDEQQPVGEADMMYAFVYLDTDANCHFGPFRPPKLASREVLEVKGYDDEYELSLQFIGNGYLKLRVCREMVFTHPHNARPPPPAAPEVFEFVGIWRDEEKDRIELLEERAKARRSPSPRETWFEMNHPMGSWNQSRWF